MVQDAPALQPNRLADHATPTLLENSYGLWALFPMLATWLLARRLHSQRLLLAVWPYLLLLAADSLIGDFIPSLATLYALCALAVVLLFVFNAEVLSASFAAYLRPKTNPHDPKEFKGPAAKAAHPLGKPFKSSQSTTNPSSIGLRSIINLPEMGTLR